MDQIERSVTKALRTYPKLTKYVVCLPINRTSNSEKKWDDYVKKWKQIRDINSSIGVIQEIESKLIREQNRESINIFLTVSFSPMIGLTAVDKLQLQMPAQYSPE